MIHASFGCSEDGRTSRKDGDVAVTGKTGERMSHASDKYLKIVSRSCVRSTTRTPAQGSSTRHDFSSFSTSHSETLQEKLSVFAFFPRIADLAFRQACFSDSIYPMPDFLRNTCLSAGVRRRAEKALRFAAGATVSTRSAATRCARTDRKSVV